MTHGELALFSLVIWLSLAPTRAAWDIIIGRVTLAGIIAYNSALFFNEFFL